ncbi:hypothetical protein [Catenuloplanes japonicus]|uniref:hypothetical protein n=1 Tax=Catenuloplanes japonicus TaxID=33876 RepID=UPI0012F7FF36|nr:hypothetical protein [Catenuloplanes japonicus]
MSSIVDVLRLRRNAWWIVPEVVAAVALVAAGLYWNAVAPRLAEPELRARATVALATEMERASADEHARHGHQLGPDDRMLCEAEIFGIDPSGDGRERNVRTAYGYYLCASGKPGTPFLAALMNAGPVVLHLDADRPGDRLQTTTLEQDLDAQLRAMMPERFRVQARKGFTTVDPPRALRDRFEREVTSAT